MKTLLLALIDKEKKWATREGAIRGLIAIGKEAVRKGLIEGGGAKIVGQECMPVVGQECMPGEQGPLVTAVMVSQLRRNSVPNSSASQFAFQILHPPSRQPIPLNINDFSDAEVLKHLQDALGDFFAEKLAGDGAWARGVLAGSHPEDAMKL